MSVWHNFISAQNGDLIVSLKKNSGRPRGPGKGLIGREIKDNWWNSYQARGKNRKQCTAAGESPVESDSTALGVDSLIGFLGYRGNKRGPGKGPREYGDLTLFLNHFIRSYFD